MITRLIAAATASLALSAGSPNPSTARASDDSSAATVKPTASPSRGRDGAAGIPPLAPVAEVYALIDAQVAAWNRGDLDGFCAPYADDALFVSPTGLTRGRASVRARYEKRYGTERSKMGTLAIEPLEARAFPADETATAVSVAAKWTLEWPKREPATGHTLIVFRKKPAGGWELVQDASM